MTPWGTRRTLTARGRQNARVTIVVQVYRLKVLVTVIDVPFVAESILDPGQADSLGDMLVHAASEARDGTKGA